MHEPEQFPHQFAFNATETDFLIVGQSLAGSLLAFELLKRNKRIFVFDDPNQAKASDIAAGIINPVVFRRMTKSWLVDDAFPVMENTYRQLEQLLDERLYFPDKMLNILGEDAALLWISKAFASQLSSYLEPEIVLNRPVEGIIKSSSYSLINKSGKLDIQKFIFSFKKFLEKQDIIISERFDSKKLTFNANFVRYGNFSARKIIFCEGAAVSENPFFEKLTFKHSKGEVLELEIPKLNLDLRYYKRKAEKT